MLAWRFDAILFYRARIILQQHFFRLLRRTREENEEKGRE
jgi:hypothetical protein